MQRLYLLRLLVIALAFASVSAALSALPGAVLDYWYLYYSPVLISSMSFGLRGALLGSAAAVISLTALLYRVQALLILGSHDALLRLALLTGTPGPGFRELLQNIAPVLTSSEAAVRAAAIVDTSGDFALSVTKVGLGIVTITLGAGIVGWQVDQQRKLERAVHRQARTDSLTGLANYRSLIEGLEEAIATRQPFSLLLIDLDQMKAINDRYGHLAGDQALLHTSALIHQTVRIRDIACRYGGDEFVVILLETDADTAKTVSQRLLQAAAGTPLALANGEKLTISLSIGIVTSPAHGSRPTELIGAADAAMYAAKQAGGQQSAGPGLAVDAASAAPPAPSPR